MKKGTKVYSALKIGEQKETKERPSCSVAPADPHEPILASLAPIPSSTQGYFDTSQPVILANVQRPREVSQYDYDVVRTYTDDADMLRVRLSYVILPSIP